MMRLIVGVTALACLLAGGGGAYAQTVPGWMSKVSIHGYASQAYAVSEDHPIFGIPTSGTAEYRDLALQFRYDPNRRNAVVVQFRHERFGLRRTDDDVQLAWAFYQRNVSDRLSLKAGRIPLPLGIFNEAAGAATTSPFFRPAQEFYDLHYTSRTVDGVMGSASLGRPGPGAWSFDVDAYFGRWALDQWDLEQRADARGAWGAQVWANTPWPGVRIGGGAYRCKVDPTDAYGQEYDYAALHASIDADLDRWRLATEVFTGNLGEEYGRYRTWYGQVGFDVTPKLSVHARGTLARVEAPGSGHHARVSDDLGLAVNYAVHPSLLFKVEGHTNEGLLRDDLPRNLYAEPTKTRYWIASVVASF
jgi:hypothetical protein